MAIQDHWLFRTSGSAKIAQLSHCPTNIIATLNIFATSSQHRSNSFASIAATASQASLQLYCQVIATLLL
jgi:hypothetical protein